MMFIFRQAGKAQNVIQQAKYKQAWKDWENNKQGISRQASVKIQIIKQISKPSKLDIK